MHTWSIKNYVSLTTVTLREGDNGPVMCSWLAAQ